MQSTGRAMIRRWRDGARCLLACAMLATLTFIIFHPGTHHTTVITFPARIHLTYDPTTRSVRFDTADDDANAAVCVIGAATNGSETLFAYSGNAFGEGRATFQADAGGTNRNTYTLSKGVKLVNGSPTDASCGTGTLVTAQTIIT